MELNDQHQLILNSESHLLVTGGPGSGKTTVAILKAAHASKSELLPGQNILFLSFARSTVSRVIEVIDKEQRLHTEQRKRIEVETYHSFFWRLLKTHGYLLGIPRRMEILLPQDEAVTLSYLRNELNETVCTDQRKKEIINQRKEELALVEGRVCFDLFAPYAGKLLEQSSRLRRLITQKYPTIILDEFQDTNESQWRVIRNLGIHSRLICLADPEQCIYGWLGANPERLVQLTQRFNPIHVDFGSNNHRSSGTEIVNFANHVLTGQFIQARYSGISIVRYSPNPNQAYAALAYTVDGARRRLQANKQDWSIAILVPYKNMTRTLSEVLRSPPGNVREIYRTVLIDKEATVLSADIVAHLMGQTAEASHFETFVELICNYYQGKGGVNPNKTSFKRAQSLKTAYDGFLVRTGRGRPLRANSVLVPIRATYEKISEMVLTGIPSEDWNSICNALILSGCTSLKEISADASYVGFLNRGTEVRRGLSKDWSESGSYNNARSIVQNAFLREHFATANRSESGVVIMNMHKAKGKQFDEVVIFEGWPKTVKGRLIYNAERIVPENSRANDSDQVRQNLRVSITRAMQRTTILTPKNDCCILLP